MVMVLNGAPEVSAMEVEDGGAFETSMAMSSVSSSVSSSESSPSGAGRLIPPVESHRSSDVEVASTKLEAKRVSK